MKRYLLLLTALLLGFACNQGEGDTAARGSEADRATLFALFDAYQAKMLEMSPVMGTYMGVGPHDQLDDASVAGHTATYEYNKETLAKLNAIDSSAMARQDQISYTIFKAQLEDAIGDFELDLHLVPYTSDSGVHSSLQSLVSVTPFNTAEDYNAYLSRMSHFPRFFQQHQDLLNLALEKGMAQPKGVSKRILPTLDAMVTEDHTTNLFYRPFKNKPDAIDDETWAEILKRADDVVPNAVVKAYADFRTYMNETLIPSSPDDVGIDTWVRAEATYKHLIKKYTTLDLTAQEIHQTGLDEVKRIRAEMEEVIKQTGFEGDFAAFLTFLRTDERFYAKTPEELMQLAEQQTRKMEARLPEFFLTIPKRKLEVNPVPAHIAPSYTAGRYVPGPFQTDKPGQYWVNTYALETRPLYNLEALTLHEGWPGHHMDMARSQELADLPDFRRNLYLSAFGEGWGLYSERLGLEAGFYEDPYSNFGRLTYEMWRACRLVVDTGVHAMGWTRDQMITFMQDNTALSLHEIQTETDRYISWPGQALSYKIGELKIRALRKEAEEILGDKFDIRVFHDRILRNGSVPLPILREEIKAYINEG